MHLKSSLCAAVILLACPRLFAGGPLFTCNGRPVLYDITSPVPYSPDLGPLGTLTNARATDLVDECFAVWSAVPTSSFTAASAGHLADDVTELNFADYYYASGDGINPVVFDTDGAIIDSLMGIGASNDIIGFAGSDPDYSTCTYTGGLALLNGKFSTYFTYEQFKATFVHEFGHFIGLDHCQINAQYAHDGSVQNDVYIPTMFPTATDDDTSLGQLNPDDTAALTALYPASETVVNSTYGKISGTVTWKSGGPVLGANVVAQKTGDEDMSRFSCVSDYLEQYTGAYDIPVTPGSYRVYIEPVLNRFTGGSSVGPYAESLWSPSFTDRVAAAYYAGSVSVSAGETVSGIDFTAEPASGLCPAEAVMENDTESIGALRRFRDSAMNATPAGRSLVGLYYRSAPAVTAALMRRPKARQLCRLLLARMMPVIRLFAGI